MTARARTAGSRAAALLVLGVVALSALMTPPARAELRLPPADGRFDYQIGGAYPPAAGVAIVDRDRRARPAPGRYGVCYVNAFQTQPGEAGFWLHRHPTLLLRRRGRIVTDPGYPDERLLDTSTPVRRAALAAVVGRWFAGCARAGYDAVEPDNLDSWTRSRGGLTPADNRAFARLLTARAHREGIAIAQKNASELAPRGRSLGFDFAVAEECHRFGECAAYTVAYGSRVYEVEYPDAGGPANFAAACADLGSRISITYRDRDVVPRSVPGYVSRWC